MLIASVLSSEICTIHTYPTLIVTQNVTPKASEIIKKTNCTNTQLYAFFKLITVSNGKINSTYIATITKSKIELNPKTVQIYQLDQLITKKLNLPHSLVIQNMYLVDGKKAVGITPQNNIKISCDSCDSMGPKNVKLTLSNPFSQQKDQIIWISFELKKQISVFVGKSHISKNETINSNKFHKTILITDRPDLYIQKSEMLKYSNLKRDLPINTPLKFNHLAPIRLVKAGVDTKIKYISDNMELTGVAVSRNSGYYGEEVRLYSKKNKKEIFGKIIDFNTVMVNL